MKKLTEAQERALAKLKSSANQHGIVSTYGIRASTVKCLIEAGVVEFVKTITEQTVRRGRITKHTQHMVRIAT